MAFRRSVLAAALAMWFSSTTAESVTSAPKTMITGAPELKKRDDATRSDFIGYYTSPGGSSYYASVCPGPAYGQTTIGYNIYGGCDGTDSYATVYTDCYGSTAYGTSISSTYYSFSTYFYTYSASSICPYDCVSDFMLGGNNYYTSYFIQCANRSPYTFYRMSSSFLPAVATTSPTTTPYSYSYTPSTFSTSPTTTSPFPAATESDITIPDRKPSTGIKKSNNTGKIAGGVVGGLAALAGAVVALFAWWKKRRAAKSQNQGPDVPVLIEQPSNYPPGGPAPFVSVPEKAVMASSTAEQYPYPPQQQPQQQQWNPPPQQQWGQNPSIISPPGSPPPPQQMWGQGTNGGPPPVISPPGSPPPGSPPPQYFPPPAQPIGYQAPYQPPQ